jgi:hypothetical protein
MPLFSNQTTKEQRQLWTILLPSLTSVIISVIVILIVVGGTIFITLYKSSQAPGFVAALNQTSSNNSLTRTYHASTSFLDGNPTFSNAPLTIFWAMVGVGVYAVVIGLGSIIKNIGETERQTQYKHVNRDAFVRLTLTRLLVRLLGAAAAWFVLSGLTRYIFPYSLAASHVASQGNWTQHIMYALAASFAIFIGLHVLVVVIRLILLRVRLFA